MNEATVKITGVKREELIDLISLTTLHNQIWHEVYEEVFQMAL
jgi:PAS domain-containing protein